MILSKNAEKVYSIEIVKSAVKDGIRTAGENGIENMEFITGDVNKELLKLIEGGKRVDAVIFDPPRKGIEADSLVKLASHNIEEIVYISCNPSTFAREEGGKRVDAVIFDPPRKGIEADSLVKLASHNIEEIVYISCNPSTFARDSKILIEHGYKLEKIQPVDMFPQTSHIEVIGKFRLIK